MAEEEGWEEKIGGEGGRMEKRDIKGCGIEKM